MLKLTFYGVIIKITFQYRLFSSFFAGDASDQKLRGRFQADSKPSSSAPENTFTAKIFVVLAAIIFWSNMQALFAA